MLEDLLQEAIRKNDVAACRKWIEEGAKVNQIAIGQELPLCYAIRWGAIDVARYLVEANLVDVNGAEKDGDTALVRAVRREDDALCRYLVSAGAEIDVPRVVDAPLHEAARMGNEDLVRAFLEAGANINHLNRDRVTALHWAATTGAVNTCRVLVAHGASPSFVPPRQMFDNYLTPFQAAAFCGAPAALNYFITECGEDPAQRTCNGRTLLEVAEHSPPAKAYLLSLKSQAAVKSALNGVAPTSAGAPARQSSGMSPL